MRLLVFGAQGQIGQEIRARAAGLDVDIVAMSHAQADIAEPEAIAAALAQAAPALVVNAAAYTQVDRAESEQEAAFRANATGAGVVAQACTRADVPLIHLSTDYVFDGAKAAAYTEDDAIAPLGVYGRSKAEGEKAVRTALPAHIILRTSWVYGRFGSNFLKTILRLARERDTLQIVADQHGCPTGSADIADAVLRIAPRLVRRENVWGTYHFAGTGVTTWHGFAQFIVETQAQATGRSPAVLPIATAEYPTAARRPAHSQLDSGRFAATFGFRAIDWRTRTREVIAALTRNNEDGART